MNRLFLFFLFLVLGWLGGPALAEEITAPAAVEKISEEDMEIIKIMDVLNHMDLLENLDLLKDFDLLTEDNDDENHN